MILQIISFPNYRVVPSQYSTFKGSDTGKAIFQAIEKHRLLNVDEETTLIIDKSSCFKRIAQDDPVCRYYRGRVGDIFRIRNTNSVNYRMVVKPTVSSSAKKTLAMEATAELYYKAFNTTIAMLMARQNPDDAKVTDGKRVSQSDMEQIIGNDNYDQLNLDAIPNKHGQLMYVRFINREHKELTFAKLKSSQIMPEIGRIISQYNALQGVVPITDIDDGDLSKKIDIIFIYNNSKGTLIPDLKLSSDFAQLFSVQQLSFDITKYAEQPEFTLLDPNENRAEIRDQYRQNGQVITREDTLDTFNLKENNKIIAI